METFILILNGIIITTLLFSFIINNLITRNIQSITEDLFHKVNKMQDKQKVIETSVNSLGELFILIEKQKDEVSKNINDMSESIYQLLVANKNVYSALREYNETMAITLADNNKELQELISSINNTNKDATTIMEDIGKQVESLDDTFSIRRKPTKKVNKPSISPNASKYLNMNLFDFIERGFVDKFLTFESNYLKGRFMNGLYDYARNNDIKIKEINPNTLSVKIRNWGSKMVSLFKEMKKNIHEHKNLI